MKKTTVVLSAFALLSVLFGCAFPKKNTNFVEYESGKNLQLEPTRPENIKLIREQLPQGLTFKNNVLEVEPGFEKKIVLLGRISTQLEKGTAGFNRPVHQLNGYFKDPDDLTGVDKYCQYNVLNVLPFPFLNYLNPLIWPCFFAESYLSEDSKDIKYREDLLVKEIRKTAANKGANMVVAFSIGGIALVNGNGAALANQSAWSANGYAVYYK